MRRLDVRAEGPLRSEWEAAVRRSDEVFDRLLPGAWLARPIPDRHRPIFYLGHLEAFDWGLLIRRSGLAPSFHPSFDALFQRGIDPPPGEAPNDRPSDWPAVTEVLEYRERARRTLWERWDQTDPWLRHMALEHRLMHAETLAYLLHALAPELKRREVAVPLGGPEPRPEERAVPAGMATLGQADDSVFGWDNERPAHRVQVPAFSIRRHKVTNGELVAWVEQGASPPPFWLRRQGEWWLRGTLGEAPLPRSAPAYVTHAQASGYAAWLGASLPTEAQWHRAAFNSPGEDERPFPWGAQTPSPALGHFDFQGWDPVAVSAHPRSASALGVEQLVGNGWEWTATPFGPFAGFAAHPGYPGYSADFFDGQHFVLKGGGPRTAARLLRRSFRNWFRPEYPYLPATFRLVR